MINSKSFIKEPGNEDSHPLHDCYRWARNHCMQSASAEEEPQDSSDGSNDAEEAENADNDDEHITPMIVYTKQYGDASPDTPTFRQFVASTISSFVAYYVNAKPTDRHCDEIVGLGPCKAYCDLELEFDDGKAKRLGYANMADLLQKHGCADRDAMRAKLEQSADKWIEHVRADLQEKHGSGTRVTAVVTKAHKESKWSKHVVFAGSLWRSTAHMGAYMRRKVRELGSKDGLVRLYVDTVVYSRFRAMRMYRSSKLKEPTRALLLANGKEKQNDAVDTQVLIDSLITVLPIPPPLSEDGAEQAAGTYEPIYTTTTFLDRYPEMVGAFGLQPLESPEILTSRLLSSIGAGPTRTGDDFSAIADTGSNDPHSPADFEFRRTFRKHFGQLKPYAFKWLERNGILLVECKTHECVILGGSHENNHIYIEIDVLQRIWRYACHSERCVNRPTAWRDLYADLAAMCADFAPRWRYAQKCTAVTQLIAGIN